MLSFVLLVFMCIEAREAAPLPQLFQNSPIKHIFPGLQSLHQSVQPVQQTPAQLLQPQSSMYQGLPSLTQPQSSIYQGLPLLTQLQSPSVYQGLPALTQPLPPYIQAMLANNPELLHPQNNFPYGNYDLKQSQGILGIFPIHINVIDALTFILKFIQSIVGSKFPFLSGLTIQSTNPPIPPGTDINQESLTALGGPLTKMSGINTQYVPFPFVVLVPQPMQTMQNNGYETVDTKSDL